MGAECRVERVGKEWKRGVEIKMKGAEGLKEELRIGHS